MFKRPSPAVHGVGAMPGPEEPARPVERGVSVFAGGEPCGAAAKPQVLAGRAAPRMTLAIKSATRSKLRRCEGEAGRGTVISVTMNVHRFIESCSIAVHSGRLRCRVGPEPAPLRAPRHRVRSGHRRPRALAHDQALHRAVRAQQLHRHLALALPSAPKLLITPIFPDSFRFFPVFPWTSGRAPWIPGVQTLKMGEKWGKMGKKWVKNG